MMKSVGRGPTNPDSLLKDGSRIGVRASDVKEESVEWLWEGRLAVGKITILDGDPDVGKSTISCDISAALTNRDSLPNGVRYRSAVGVVLINAEDSASDTIRPRLAAAGADLTRCMIVSDDANIDVSADLPKIDPLIHTVGAKLVVIDPLMAHLPEKKNSWNDQHMRSVLAPLRTWAERVGVAVLLIRHPNKGAEKKAIYRGGGSIGIIGAARFGLFAAEHPYDPDLRVLSSSKCNIGRRPRSLAYRIVGSDPAPEIGVVRWEGEADLTANDLVGYSQPTRDSEIDVAVAFLSALLASGPVPSTEVTDKARAARISKRTLDRAKDTLGVRSRKQGTQWYWELPAQPDYFANGVATTVPF